MSAALRAADGALESWLLCDTFRYPNSGVLEIDRDTNSTGTRYPAGTDV